MDYKIVITEDARLDLDRFLFYLINYKRNRQAAANVLADYKVTVRKLAEYAGTVQLCINSRLKKEGYSKYHFQNHRYYLLYRIDEGTVFVDGIFHELQDPDQKIQ